MYKELQLALQEGYKATVLQFTLHNWSDAKTEALKSELEQVYPIAHDYLELISLEAIPSRKLDWLYWGLSEKLAKKAYKLMSNHLKWNVLGNSRRALQLLKAAKQINLPADLICAHNLGALYPAYQLGKQCDVPFIFDVEDYHPGETVSFDAKNEKRRREFLMQTLLPKAKAVTFASPLIEQYSTDLVGSFNSSKTILNGFNADEFLLQEDSKTDAVLSLVWFSQKISFGRGLEQLFEALIHLKQSHAKMSLELTLIGEMDADFQKKVIQPLEVQLVDTAIHVIIKAPLQQKQLHAEVCCYDVGLALEFDSRDLNRQICLTNKIITYAQAGLYILATDTKAQKQFISEHPELGILSKQSPQSLADALLRLCENTAQIKGQKRKRFELGAALSWDQEQEKLKKIWQQIL